MKHIRKLLVGGTLFVAITLAFNGCDSNKDAPKIMQGDHINQNDSELTTVEVQKLCEQVERYFNNYNKANNESIIFDKSKLMFDTIRYYEDGDKLVSMSYVGELPSKDKEWLKFHEYVITEDGRALWVLQMPMEEEGAYIRLVISDCKQ